MRATRPTGAAIAVLCAILGAATAWAQQPAQPENPHPEKPRQEKPYALIFGTVYGPDDHPVYGARVQIRRADGGKVKGGDELLSDHQGEFALRLPAEAADYLIRATAKSGKRKLSAETKAHIDFDERADVGLHLRE